MEATTLEFLNYLNNRGLDADFENTVKIENAKELLDDFNEDRSDTNEKIEQDILDDNN